MAFTGAATVVVAQVFELLDPNGVIAATLATGTAPFGTGAPTDGLTLFHRDAATTDSELGWTHPGIAGNESAFLQGPVSAGGAADNRPVLLLQREPATPATKFFLYTGRPDGTFGTLQTGIDGSDDNAGNGTVNVTAKTLNLQNDSMPVQSRTFVSRGNLFGVRFFDALLAGVVNTNAAVQTVLTINLPASPIVVQVDVSFYMTVTINVAGSVVTAQVFVDGVANLPFAVMNNPPLGGQTLSSRRVFGLTTGVAHTITLTVLATAGNQLPGGNTTDLSVTLYG